jgi:hypothetical protein
MFRMNSQHKLASLNPLVWKVEAHLIDTLHDRKISGLTGQLVSGNVILPLEFGERPKLSHAGPVTVNRAAEQKPLSGVGCSAWLLGIRLSSLRSIKGDPDDEVG